MASYDSFIARYRTLFGDVEALNPNTRAAGDALLHLMDRQQQLFAELQAHPSLSDNRTLLTLDSAVISKMAQKQLDHFRHIASM